MLPRGMCNNLNNEQCRNISSRRALVAPSVRGCDPRTRPSDAHNLKFGLRARRKIGWDGSEDPQSLSASESSNMAPADLPCSALPTEITRMNVEQQSIRERTRLEIDEKLGFILAVVAGALLSIAAGGWIILLSNITGLKSSFDASEAQRFAQLGQIEGTVGVIEEKVGTITSRFQQVEALTKQNTDALGKVDARLRRLEEEADRPKRQGREVDSGKNSSKP
jgi:hypothetical protein